MVVYTDGSPKRDQPGHSRKCSARILLPPHIRQPWRAGVLQALLQRAAEEQMVVVVDREYVFKGK